MKSLKVIVYGVIGTLLSMPPAFGDAASVRDRLVEAARASEKLKEKAGVLPGDTAKTLGIEAELPEDRTSIDEKRFARASDAAAYVHMRPWSIVYRGDSGWMDMCRRYAVNSLNEIAGKEVVSLQVLQDLSTPGRSKAALAELRRVAKELNMKG